MLEEILYLIPVVLFAISIHEFSHAFAAHKLGDPTPKLTGRLSLNPMAHMDPIGALMFLFFRIGWAKPVQVNPLYFKNRRRDMMIVAVAGPVANVMVAFISYRLLGVLHYLPFGTGIVSIIYMLLMLSVQLNLMLAAFNLIPLPPLDGSKILAGLLPLEARIKYERLSEYAPIIFLLGIVTGFISRLISPIYGVLLRLITFI